MRELSFVRRFLLYKSLQMEFEIHLEVVELNHNRGILQKVHIVFLRSFF